MKALNDNVVMQAADVAASNDVCGYCLKGTVVS